MTLPVAIKLLELVTCIGYVWFMNWYFEHNPPL